MVRVRWGRDGVRVWRGGVFDADATSTGGQMGGQATIVLGVLTALFFKSNGLI